MRIRCLLNLFSINPIKTFATLLLIIFSQLAYAITESTNDIEIQAPWIRLPPPVSNNSAGYFVLQNKSENTYILTGISSSISDDISIHETQIKDDKYSMMPVKEVTIAPNSEVIFQPKGLHLMFMGIKQPLTLGQEVEVILHFANKEEIAVYFVVSKMPTTENDDQHDHHNHH